MRIEYMLDHVEQEPTEHQMREAQRIYAYLKALPSTRTLHRPVIDNEPGKDDTMSMTEQLPPRCAYCGEYIPPKRVVSGIKRPYKTRYCSNECGAQAYRERRNEKHPRRYRLVQHDENAASMRDCKRCVQLLAYLGEDVALPPTPCIRCGENIPYHRALEALSRRMEPTYCSPACVRGDLSRRNNKRLAAKVTKHTCKMRGRWGHYDAACVRCEELQIARPSRQAVWAQAKREAART